MKRLLLLFLLLPTFAWAQPATTVQNWPTTNSSVTTGNTFQQVLASVPIGGAVRRSLNIENNNTNGDNCWIFFGTTAAATKATAIMLLPGGSYTRYYPYVPSDALQATCTTTGDSLYVDTQ